MKHKINIIHITLMKLKKLLLTLLHFFLICIVWIGYSSTLKQKNKKKIIIGVTEIAGVLSNIGSFFNNKSITVCKNKHQFYTSEKYDISVTSSLFSRMIILPFIFGKLAKNANAFFYIWNDGFLFHREWDFLFLKKKKIPIICSFLGDDIRSRILLLEYCKSINFHTFVEYDQPELFLSSKYDEQKKAIAEITDQFASLIFSHPYDQISYLRSEQVFLPMLSCDNILYYKNTNFFSNADVLRIIHAPSSPVIKATPVVRSVISKLQNEGYCFEYIELINVTHDYVLSQLKQSHIVLNQFYALLPGIFGLESMATCNAVLMSAKSSCFPYQNNEGWIETEDWQLYDNLKYLLDNPQNIQQYAQNGYNYIKKNFTLKKIQNYITDQLHAKNIYI